jgi:hypothetical protein
MREITLERAVEAVAAVIVHDYKVRGAGWQRPALSMIVARAELTEAILDGSVRPGGSDEVAQAYIDVVAASEGVIYEALDFVAGAFDQVKAAISRFASERCDRGAWVSLSSVRSRLTGFECCLIDMELRAMVRAGTAELAIDPGRSAADRGGVMVVDGRPVHRVRFLF